MGDSVHWEMTPFQSTVQRWGRREGTLRIPPNPKVAWQSDGSRLHTAQLVAIIPALGTPGKGAEKDASESAAVMF